MGPDDKVSINSLYYVRIKAATGEATKAYLNLQTYPSFIQQAYFQSDSGVGTGWGILIVCGLGPSWSIQLAIIANNCHIRHRANSETWGQWSSF